ncbi:MAG: polysaccharide export protein, partial [Mesorhizobium sp.]
MGVFHFAKSYTGTMCVLLASLSMSACTSTSSTTSSSPTSVDALQLTSSSAPLSGGGALQVVKELPAPQNT